MSIILSILGFLAVNTLTHLIKGKVGHYWYHVGICLSQLGNVIFGDVLNFLAYKWWKKDAYLEINADESISGKTGKNLKRGTLFWLGHFIDWLTNIFEYQHIENSIEDNP